MNYTHATVGPGRRMLTVREAAQVLGVSHHTMQSWIRRGMIRPLRRPGLRVVRIHPDELERFCRGGLTDEPSEAVR